MSDPNGENFSVAAIPALAQRRHRAEVWREADGARTWLEFGCAVEAVRLRCQWSGVVPGEIIVTPGETSLDSLAWLFGSALAGHVVLPLRRERQGEIHGWSEFLEIGWQVRAGRLERDGRGRFSPEAAALLGPLRARARAGLILATGGTTGAPKILLHDLDALLATIPVKDGAPRRMLPLMRFDHIGGLDMAWRALARGQVLVAPPPDFAPEAIAETIARHQVEILPATPSLLNLLLLGGAVERSSLASLRVVPHGAEPMPAGLLGRLKAALPQAEFLQRFGTSETGAVPVRATPEGLVLEAGGGAFAWKVVDGELWIKSPSRALGYLSGGPRGLAEDGWFRTGDLAETWPDGGIRVLGRRDELINVGGEKVLPTTVESALLAHPQVSDCRVTAHPNAVLGQVVAAEVVWRGEPRDPVAVKRRLHEFAGALLSRVQLPVVVKLVEAIETTGNLKKSRVFS